jgi:hypothetical protein
MHCNTRKAKEALKEDYQRNYYIIPQEFRRPT